MTADRSLILHLRRRTLRPDPTGHFLWEPAFTVVSVPAAECAILVCDMWDRHYSRIAEKRIAELAPRLNAVLQAAHARGVHIIHSPSDVLEAYEGTPARLRIQSVPPVEPPANHDHADPPMPIDGDIDYGEVRPPVHPKSCQHAGVEIDQSADVITDSGREVYSYMHAANITRLFLTGVHTNRCVLNRTFGIKQMVRWGVDTALVRDLTTGTYNPTLPPYVSHAEGMDLLIRYIESFWCPSVASEDFVG